ncbi:MAG TPA: hypothetical protein VJS30_31195 [Paraburkholderia sp.]|nr:hypothetical protein [Paraburkholderia sp.]
MDFSNASAHCDKNRRNAIPQIQQTQTGNFITSPITFRAIFIQRHFYSAPPD